MSDRSASNVIYGIIGRNSLLAPEDAEKLASAIVDEMGLTFEVADIQGLNWLSVPKLFRWVSPWRP